VALIFDFKKEDLNKPSFLLYARIPFFYPLKEPSIETDTTRSLLFKRVKVTMQAVKIEDFKCA